MGAEVSGEDLPPRELIGLRRGRPLGHPVVETELALAIGERRIVLVEVDLVGVHADPESIRVPVEQPGLQAHRSHHDRDAGAQPFVALADGRRTVRMEID